MAAYVSSSMKDRHILVPVVEDAFATVYVEIFPDSAMPVRLEGAADGGCIYYEPEVGAFGLSGNVYNFPFVLHSDGTPWIEVNSFLLAGMKDKSYLDRPSDDVRRDASELIEYLRFCESNGIDWTDFSGARPIHRPTYRYFKHLVSDSGRGRSGINRYTGVVYRFYVHAARYWIDLDIERVDTVTHYKQYVASNNGAFLVDRYRRKLTVSVAPSPTPDINTVRDDGEDLRPLNNQQFDSLRWALEQGGWHTQDRLIIEIAYMAGARKQTILTLRLRHLEQMTEGNLRGDGTYALRVGPGSGVDTKKGKPQTIYIPKGLAARLKLWAASKAAAIRRKKFIANYEANGNGGGSIAERDIYLFLSNQGKTYYMAKDDPRYPFLKTVPVGQVTDYMTGRMRSMLSVLPKDFTFHWLRATFAYQLYQYLQLAVQKKLLAQTAVISIIQSRMAHAHRETTENYLKLFTTDMGDLAVQEGWEEWLMGSEGLGAGGAIQ